MPEARETLTGQRLDDLSRRIDNGFDRVDRRLEHLETRIDSMQRLMVQLSAGSTLAILATLVTVVLTRA